MNNTAEKNKIKNIIEEIRVGMLSTMNRHGEMRARPMATAQCDEQGNIWFITDKHSVKVQELSNHQPILLSYADSGSSTFLSLTGTAKAIEDQAKIRELFNPMVKAWYPEGPDGEDIHLIHFSIETAEYWDAPDSKLVRMWKIGKALVKGEKYEAEADSNKTVSFETVG